jgi:predicted amidohydrolase YtcJ
MGMHKQRYPTKAELDAAAPRHPVLFRTGPDASLNSLALQLSGIDRDFKVTDGGGFAEKANQPVLPADGLFRHTRAAAVTKNLGSVTTTAAEVIAHVLNHS